MAATPSTSSDAVTRTDPADLVARVTTSIYTALRDCRGGEVDLVADDHDDTTVTLTVYAGDPDAADDEMGVVRVTVEQVSA